MYTVQENVRVVISLLKDYNIKHIVISPGGTNIPVTQAIQQDSFFKCYSVPDERSAMYFAIGIYLQTGNIVATSCTSAQATRNYIPGLTEAFYKHVPILAITTSKLERFEYQDYMQAPIQVSLPIDSIKSSYDLPPITDENTRIQCIHNARKAILDLMHRRPGPVQLNIRIVDSQQGEFCNTQLPSLRIIKRYMAWEEWNDLDLNNKRILIIIGEHRPFISREKQALENFCKSHNAVVYVNHCSNYHGAYSIQGNLLVSCCDLQSLKPDLFITIGGQTGDYSIYGALNKLPNVEHWRVSEDGEIIDTYNKLTKVFECPDFYFFERLKKETETVSHDYYESWKCLYDKLKYDIDIPFSNLYAAQCLYKSIPENSIINYAILNSLRCWSYFPLSPSIQGYANIAAFGIDGCNSMLIGESMNYDDLCFIITGDLAFFYDMNALGIRHIKNNIRILLINNSGGAEFKLMTNNWSENINVGDYISANGHNGNAKGWAENCGFKYIQATNKNEFESLKDIFISSSNKPILFELFTDSNNEIIAIKDFLKANKITSTEDKIKNVISSIIGKENIGHIKKILKR